MSHVSVFMCLYDCVRDMDLEHILHMACHMLHSTCDMIHMCTSMYGIGYTVQCVTTHMFCCTASWHVLMANVCCAALWCIYGMCIGLLMCRVLHVCFHMFCYCMAHVLGYHTCDMCSQG